MPDNLDLSDLGRNPSSITLKEATRDEIFRELEGRFKAVLLLTLTDLGDDADDMQMTYAGGFYPVLGMATSFIDTHLASQRERNH